MDFRRMSTGEFIFNYLVMFLMLTIMVISIRFFRKVVWGSGKLPHPILFCKVLDKRSLCIFAKKALRPYFT